MVDDGETAQQNRLLSAILLPGLFIIFGMSGWMSVDTIWIEMPILVTALPEAWDLASFVVVLVQLGNIGPLLMVFLGKRRRNSFIIFATIVTLIAAQLTLAFVYKFKTQVAGSEHSVAFFVIVFVMSLCDCTSNVTFLPYLANFNKRYLAFYFIGSGLSGLVPAVLGLIQGASEYTCFHQNSTAANVNSTFSENQTNQTISSYPMYSEPKFTFPVFMYVAVGLLVLSLCAFIFLEIALRHFRRRAKADVIQLRVLSTQTAGQSSTTEPAENDEGDGKISQFIPFYVINIFICFMVNGFLPSIESYSAMQYGPLAYTLIVCLTAIAVPTASWLSMFVKIGNVKIIGMIVAAGVVPIAYDTMLAFLCPDVPLAGEVIGDVLVVVTWFASYFTLYYARISMAQEVRRGGHRPLFWFGIFTQIGSFLGAVTTFLLLPVFKVLKSPVLC